MNDNTAPRDISSRVDSFPEPWKPKVGDKLVGTVIGVGSRLSEYGEYPIVSVLIDDGSEFDFHAFHTVAKNELARQRPAPGDRIAVKYFGRSDEGPGAYERYRVLVDKPKGEENAPDWDAIQEQAEAELDAEDYGEGA